MATIQEIINLVDYNKPNAFTEKEKLAWIAELDGKIAADVMMMDIVEIRKLKYEYPEDLESEPLVEFPHDSIYELWLSAKIDFANGEYNKYQNTMALYNAEYGNFVRWFASFYAPSQGYSRLRIDCAGFENPPYYLTAYGMAVKMGFEGTKEEWLQSLRGAAATIYRQSVTYQVGDSGTVIPSGAWGSSVPVVDQGKYLWTKTELQFNTGDPIISYSVGRMGIDGSGAVSSVAGVSPDVNGNVALTAADVDALPSSGGDMTGEIRMNGNPVSGLNAPVEDTQAANKAYVDTAKAEAKAYTDTAKAEAKSYTDSKRLVLTAVIAAENWVSDSTLYVNQVTVAELKSSDMPHIVPSYNWESGTPYTQKEAWDKVSYATSLDGAINFVALEDLPTTDIPIQIEVNR